ncbi:MAG: DNA topoisomerase (ATP-hydrolyzing) subunit A [Oscillospiraceae bacterium]|nr:DNA topoisomerase (ATP-hydrolyzing) subunit A [Oscillospiraceae bacterium]
MPRKPKTSRAESGLPDNAHIAGAGLVESQPITQTLESNFMPYAMSVIMSRAIPEIDGFKPSHRKLLYTMYKMGLLTGPRTKSANIVGQTMKFNPHGDAAIYETMVRLSRGYQALLHPYVDSKGNFGRAYSSDMEYAAARYTEAKLDPIAAELFADIDKDTVDFVDNYDATLTEPTLLPVGFPSILVNNNIGIAVGMACAVCSFNLREVCETTIALIKKPDHDIAATLKAPDFPGGGLVVYNRAELENIYETGRGSVKVRAVYTYDKAANCIDVTEIPSTTTVEAIIAKLTELVKNGRVKEVSDVRNEIGLKGLKITIDLKRGVDPDKLMNRLFAITPLEDSFSCNFNVLIAGAPQVLGVRRLLEEWTAFRTECVRRRVYFDLQKAKDKLHLLRGLAKILLDIDKAIAIVRGTEEEAEVVPNLMIGFGIDEVQAEYVAEIRLRHLNREYILKRTEEIASLEKTIDELESILKNPAKVKGIIIDELQRIMKKYGQERRSQLLYAADIEESAAEAEEEVPDYPCTLFFTAGGYFKKITPQSLRMAAEQKLKEGDRVIQTVEAGNSRELLFFSDKGTVYKARANDFADTKASAMGDFVATKLGFDEGESAVYMAVTTDFTGYMLFFFANGKAAKVEMSTYATKQNRRKLIGAYSDKSPAAAIFHIQQDREFMLESTSGRRLIVHTGAISPKTTRNTIGVQALSVKGQHRLKGVIPFEEGMVAKSNRYRTKSLPAAGSLPSQEDIGEQINWDKL